jgi:CheY-like chemotaxis protein
MLRILVVDDEERHRARIGRSLEEAGYVVMTAVNGLVADKLARQSAFDAIVTDMLMPEMDGLELIRSVRSRDTDIRIVAMLDIEARHGDDFRQSLETTAFIFGADAVINKPTSTAALLDALTRASQRNELYMSEP